MDLERALEGIVYPTEILTHTAVIQIRKDPELEVYVGISTNPFEVRTWVQYQDPLGRKYCGGEEIRAEEGDTSEEIVDFVIRRAQRYTRNNIEFFASTDTPVATRRAKGI